MNNKPDGTVMDISEDAAPLLAVIRMADDDATWWKHVADHAQENEWRYGLDETAEQVTVARMAYGQMCHFYDDALVLAWCQRHIEPPAWRWHYWEPVPEDDRDDEDHTHELRSSTTRVNDQWWRGAIVQLKPTKGIEAL